MLSSVKFIFYSELLLLLRRSQEWIYPIGFFIITVSLFPLTLSPDPLLLKKIMPAFIWIAALFSSLLATQHIFFSELEESNIDNLLLSDIPLTLLIFIKLAAHWLVSSVPLLILTPVLGLLCHLSFMAILTLCAGLLLGTPIFTLIISFGVTLTLGLRQQGMLLALLILPLIIPVLIFGVNIVKEVDAGFAIQGPFAFLAGLSILAITLLPMVIAMTLRITLEG